ncbi:hypothetical protein DFH11DRAFT_1882615 [Phellopilus nigrolimitatus]|nr:hypothetical protein DFH11DRAFT_1882615 [Phellopilus nigrolimitatus]
MSVDIQRQETGQIFTVLNSFLLETPAVTAGPNARLPSITHTDRPGAIILDPHTDWYTSASRPSQAGSVVIQTKRDGEDVFVLATASCEGGVVYHALSMPRARGAKVEFYSGAVYSATQVSESVTVIVIQYLD